MALQTFRLSLSYSQRDALLLIWGRWENVLFWDLDLIGFSVVLVSGGREIVLGHLTENPSAYHLGFSVAPLVK